MVGVGGRAPSNRWGTGALQEIDHLPIVSPVTKQARTLHSAAEVAAGFDDAFTSARSSHRGPVYVDIAMDEFFNSGSGPASAGAPTAILESDGDDLARIAALLTESRHPLLILGTDVRADRAEDAALRLVEALGVPILTNGAVSDSGASTTPARVVHIADSPSNVITDADAAYPRSTFGI